MRVSAPLLSLLIALTLTGCRRQSLHATHGAVRKAASAIYASLVEGDVDRYLDSFADCGDFTEAYRAEMRDLLEQYLEAERRGRGGLSGAKVIGDSILDSLNADAFVQLSFGDGTCETVNLPLRLTPKGWRLR